jgi:D-arabinose 1-dehydrogenase-like Zn-dependent alcohol dehydrogenase
MNTMMKAAIVDHVDAPWTLEDRPLPTVGPNDVLVRIHASGICGTDAWITNGTLQFHPFPVLLGHEGVGEVVAVGDAVTARKVGDRVGIPMVQATCGKCEACLKERPNSFVSGINCTGGPRLTGVTVDGAFAEYIAADAEGTVVLPEGISYEDAAPTLCAGYTVWAALRKAQPKPGATIGVVGIGGLGHLAIQYAKAAGYRVVAVTKSAGKYEVARQLGADEVVADGAALRAAGGADVLLHTSNSHAAAVDAMNGLQPWGKVVVMGVATDEMNLPAGPLAFQGYEVIGSAHNGTEYLMEALELVAQGKVKPMIEVYPKERIGEAYEATSTGRARFRSVVTF